MAFGGWGNVRAVLGKSVVVIVCNSAGGAALLVFVLVLAAEQVEGRGPRSLMCAVLLSAQP